MGTSKLEYEMTTDESSSEENEARENCPICLLPFKCQDIGTPESCDHNYCLECIVEWSKNVNTCPFDRQVFHLIFARHRVNGPIFNTIKVADRELEEQEEINPYEQTYCEICGEANNEDRLLLCDICDLGYHMDCLTPALSSIPENDWFCPECNVHSEVLPSHSSAASTSSAISSGRRTHRPLRSIPRTSRNRRVFRRITNAILSSESEGDSNDESSSDGSDEETLYRLVEEEEAASSQSAPSTSSSSKRTVAPKRKIRKRRTKSVRKRRTSTKKGSKTRSKRKKRGSRRRSWLSNSTIPTSKSVKSRLAARLGLVPPKPGTALPQIKNTVKGSIGNEVLSIFGETPRAEQQTRFRNQTWTVSSNLAPVVNLGRRPFFPETPVPKPTTSTLTSSTDVLGELLPGLSLLSSKADLVKEHDGTLKLRNSKSADNLLLSPVNSSDFSKNHEPHPSNFQSPSTSNSSLSKSDKPSTSQSENSTSAPSSPGRPSKIPLTIQSNPVLTKPAIVTKLEDSLDVKQEPTDITDRLDVNKDSPTAIDSLKPSNCTTERPSPEKGKPKIRSEHNDSKMKMKERKISRSKLKIKTDNECNTGGLKSFKIPKKSKMSVEECFINPSKAKSKTSIELNLKITLDGIAYDKDNGKNTDSLYSKIGCDKLEQYSPITGKPLQEILSSLYIEPEPVSLTVCPARPIKVEGRKLYSTRDNEEIIRNWKKEHGTPEMSPIGSTDSSELAWSLPPPRTPDPVVEISTDEEDEKANMRRIVTQKLKLEAMKGIDLDVAFARSRSRSPLRKFNDPVTRLTPIKDRLGVRKGSSRRKRSWSRDRERRIVDDSRSGRRTPSHERRSQPRRARRRSSSRERRRRSLSRERRRSPSRERRRSPKKSPSRKRVSPYRKRRRSRSKSRGRRRSPSREKTKNYRSRDKRDRRSWSRDQRVSRSRDKRGSISRDRRRSVSRDKRRSPSRDRRRSMSYDERRSISRDKRRSISRGKFHSVSRDKLRSVSHDRRRSMSRDRHRSKSRSRKNKRSRSPKRRDHRSRSRDRTEKHGKTPSRSRSRELSNRRTNGAEKSSSKSSVSLSPSRIRITDGTLASELKLKLTQKRLEENTEVVELESDEGELKSHSHSSKNDMESSIEKSTKKNKKRKHKKVIEKKRKHKRKKKADKSEIDLTKDDSDVGVMSVDESRSGSSQSAPSRTEHDNQSSPAQVETADSEPYSPTQMLLYSGPESPQDNHENETPVTAEDLEKRAEEQALQVIALLKNEVADPDLIPRAQPPKSVSQKPLVIDWLVQRSENQEVSTSPKEAQSPSRQGEEEESLVSATEYNNKQLIDKLAGQERIADEVKMVLKPFYVKHTITKEEYKIIMRNCVTKIYQRSQGRVNPAKVKDFVEKYVGTIIARRSKT